MKFPLTRKQVLLQLADGQFHSGAELSNNLGISRSAIWKQLNSLKQFGLEFSAVSGKGYRLENPLELLDRQQLLDNLPTTVNAQINSLHIHDSLASTNVFLCDQPVPNGAIGGAEICLTEHQSAGKGRRGRQWVSPFGSNIYLSVLRQYQQGPAALAGLSLAAGVAVVRALNKMGYADIGLKWPNDIYWQQKKLGGILVEVRGDSEGPCTVVVGIGINLILSDENASDIDQPWVDLKRVNNHTSPARNLLIAEIISQLISILADFEDAGISAIIDEWRGYDCMRGQQVTLTIGDHKITGVIQGVDEQGLVTLQHSDGEVVAYASGEVTFHGD